MEKVFRAFPANDPKGWWVFFGAWIILNLLQAFLTPLVEDEAYYWMYSNFLDWGYFDHPPMIALFIRAGSWIAGEGGVRLVTVLAQGGALWLIWKLLSDYWPGPHQPALFFAIAFSVFLFQVYGFIATPDSPLLFFSAAFFFLYLRFLEKPGLVNSLLLGVVCAALLYSKYHGILLIGFTVLSNPALFRKASFYGVALIGLLLFLPHLHWQYVHDFPSFRYHLVERSTPFRWWYVIEFILNMAIVYNPLLWPSTIRTIGSADWKPTFERALLFNFIGFLLFFFLSSLRGHVQPQWTAIATLPLIILLYLGNYQHENYRRKLIKVAVIFLPLVLIARIIIAIDFFSIPFQLNQPESYARAIHQFAGDRKVVFNNSFQRASIFGFYNQDTSVFSASMLTSRKTQFDIWQLEASFHQKPVVWIGGQLNPRDHFFTFGEDTVSYTLFDSFLSFHKVRPLASDLPGELQAGREYEATIQLFNVYPYDLDLGNAADVRLAVFWIKKGQLAATAATVGKVPFLKGGHQDICKVRFTVPPTLPAGAYAIGFAFQYGDLQAFPAGNWKAVIVNE